MTHRCRLLILEDDPRRTTAMRERLADRFPQYEALILADAPSFIAALKESVDRVLAVSLDHDLEPQPGAAADQDPGTGRDAADYLAKLRRTARGLPVLLHTTNILAADGMERVLVEAGYAVQRVVPYGDLDWIAEAWFPAFRRHILRTADGPHASTPATPLQVEID